METRLINESDVHKRFITSNHSTSDSKYIDYFDVVLIEVFKYFRELRNRNQHEMNVKLKR